MRRRNSFSESGMLQSLEIDRIPPRSRPLPTRQGSSQNVQRHMSRSGPVTTSKLGMGPPISMTSVNTTSENDTKEAHHGSKAGSSEVKSDFRPALTRQVADIDDPAVISTVKRKAYKTDSIIVSSPWRSSQTRRNRNGSIDRDKNHKNSTTVAKSMMSFIEEGLPPTSPSKQRAVKGSEKSRRPPKLLPPLPPLSSEEAQRRRRSRRSGSGPSPFQLDQSCKDNIRRLSKKAESNASPSELDQSYVDEFPPCSFHGPCEEDSHAIFEFRRIFTTTIDGILHLSLPVEVEVKGPRGQERRTRSVDSKSRQLSSLGNKATRSKSSSRSCSRGDENKSLPGVPPRPKKSTEKQPHTEETRQKSRSPGAKDDLPVTSSSSGADHDVVYAFKRLVMSSPEVDRHSRRRTSASIDGDHYRNTSNERKISGLFISGYSVKAGKDDEVFKTNRSSGDGASPREDRPEGVSSRKRSGSIDNSLLQRRPSSNESSDSQRLRTCSGSIDQLPWKATAMTTHKRRTSPDSNDGKTNISILQHPPEQGKPKPKPDLILGQRIDHQEASTISPVPGKKNATSQSKKVGVLLRKHTEDSLTPPSTSAFVKASSKKSKSHQISSTRDGAALDQDDRSRSTTVSSLSSALRSTRSREKLMRRDSFNGCSVFADLEQRSNGMDAAVSSNKNIFASSSKMNTITLLLHSIDVEERSVSTTSSKASGGRSKQGRLGSFNGAEAEVESIDLFLNHYDESTQNQRPRIASDES